MESAIDEDNAAGAPGIIKLPPEVNISASATVKVMLADALAAADSKVALDGGEVAAVDTSGLQLLTAFVRDAGHRGASVEWMNPSDVLRETACRIGLAGELKFSC
ncbi:MAG: STAS domain-containing protein [Gammaproteobacteria bacterium]|nr:STAS domain-containing protein [Gammaproteobacteria bacterium]